MKSGAWIPLSVKSAPPAVSISRDNSDFLNQNPACDLVKGNGYISDSAGVPVRRVKATGFSVPRYLYGVTTWMQQSTFFRRSVFEAVGGFNLQNRSCWDGELFVNMVAKGAKVGFLNSDLAVFRGNGMPAAGALCDE